MRMIYLLVVLFPISIFAQVNGQRSITEALDEAGRLKPGISGSFNSEGYQMAYGPNGEPVFRNPDAKTSSNTFAFGTLGSGRMGTNADIKCMAADGLGNIYVGGSFTIVGDVAANFIARWDGSAWHSLPCGTSNGVNNAVYSIAANGTTVYCGGIFTTLGDGSSAKYIAKWNATANTWSNLPVGASNGLGSSCVAVCINGSDVYVGGNFTTLGDGTSAKCVAKWNETTSTWSTLASGASNGVSSRVNAIAVIGSDVYLGGQFTLLGDGATSANRIVKWNNGTWTTLPIDASNGVAGEVQTFAVSGTDLYLGGFFTKLGNSTTITNYIAKWNTLTSTWSTIPSGAGFGLNAAVYFLKVVGSDLFVGGNFTLLGDGTTSAKYIAKWNISAGTWSTLPKGASNGFSSAVMSIGSLGTDVYIGGTFGLFGDNTTAAYFVKWTGSALLPVGTNSSGTTNSVYAVAVNGTDIYIGGIFISLPDGTVANRIAKWNGSNWSTLGVGSTNGVNGQVSAIAVIGTDVYVGGVFTLLGDGVTSAKYIAKWNGSSWSALVNGASNGLNSTVNALAVIGTDLYVGGAFNFLGDGVTSAKYIAKWNGSTWSTLASGTSNGVSGTVNALAVSGTALYVGGAFSGLGNNTGALHIAKWDVSTSTWSTLTSGSSNGVNSTVSALAVSGTTLYVGGSFTALGDGTSALRIAKWNGSAWSTFPIGATNGLSGSVTSLAVAGSNVYIGGTFAALGDGTTAAVRFVKWNGNSWEIPANAANSTVRALAYNSSDQKLYIGGTFTILGGTVAAYYIGTLKDAPATRTLALTALIQGRYNGTISVPDTLTVLLRKNWYPYDIADSATTYADPTGACTVTFTGNSISDSSYYIVVKHRGSIETWSADGVAFTGGSASYDFTTLIFQAYGNNLIQVGSKYCIYTGDVDASGFIDNNDLLLIDNAAFVFTSGYVIFDVDGTGFVDNNDLLLCDNNAYNFVAKKTPLTPSRNSPMPLRRYHDRVENRQ